MAAIILPRRFNQQPQYPVEIDWNNPITRGLKFGWSAGSRIDFVREVLPSVYAPIGATNKGLAALGDGTNYVQFASAPSVVSTSYSVFALIRLTTSSEFYVVSNEIAYTNQWRLSGYQSGGNLNINAPGGSDSNTGARTVNSNVFSIGVSCDSGVTNGLKYYRDGLVKVTLTGTPPTLSGSRPITVNRKNYAEAANPSGADTLFVLMWDRPLTDVEQLALEQNPWQLFKRQPQVLYFTTAAGGATYTLTAAAGSFTETGNAANLLFNRKLTAAAGSFALTGNSAGLAFNRKLVATVGAFTLTGNDASLTAQRKLTASTGTFSFTGNAAGLTAQRKLTASTGAFILTGNAATLTYNHVGSYTLTCNTGSFTLTGNTTGLKAARKIVAGLGQFTLTGNATQLLRNRVLIGGTGVFVLTGNNVNLTANIQKKLICETGVFTFSGKPVVLSWSGELHTSRTFNSTSKLNTSFSNSSKVNTTINLKSSVKP